MKISETRVYINLCDKHKHLVPVGGVRADDAENRFCYTGDVRCDFFDDSDEPGCQESVKVQILVTIPMEAKEEE